MLTFKVNRSMKLACIISLQISTPQLNNRRFPCSQHNNASTQQTQNICITFVQRRPNIFDVGQNTPSLRVNRLKHFITVVLVFVKWLITLQYLSKVIPPPDHFFLGACLILCYGLRRLCRPYYFILCININKLEKK